jgi:thiol-disulfide isomerase/thioredoxin
MILERVFFTATVLIAVWAGTKGVEFFSHRVVNRRMKETTPPFRSGDGSPTIVYFWSEGCPHCRLQEAQIVEAQKTLELAGTSIAISKHNAVTESRLSRSMNILTVPSTVLLDGGGKVLSWNAGFRDHRQLVAQFLRSSAENDHIHTLQQ